MNQFSERYKTFSNSDLLRVIENKSDYQPEAAEAALFEFNQRNLSEQDLTNAKYELEAVLQEKEKSNQKRADVEQRVKNIGTLIFKTINPIQKSAPTTRKLIILITIVFAMLTLFKWVTQFELFIMMLTDTSTGWDFSVFEFMLPLVFLPIATILFGFRKKIGWILMAIYLTYSTISAFGLIIMTWNMEPLGNSALDHIFSQPSMASLILITLFFGSTLWILNRKRIMEQYHINRITSIITMGIVALLTILLIAPFY